MNRPVAVSTFSGPGGSSLGYERAGFDVRVAVDCAPGEWGDAILDTYRANHPETTLLERDVRTVTGDELASAAWTDDVALLDGSPPCSPFSNVNASKAWADHESGTLFDEFVRLVDELEPRTVVAENVPSLATGATKGYFNQLRDDIEAAGPGYRLRVQRIDAAYLGAAQHRDRLIFHAVRADLSDVPPAPIEPSDRPKTVREAWAGLDDRGDVERARAYVRNSSNYSGYVRLRPGENLARDVYDSESRGKYDRRLAYGEVAPTALVRPHLLHPDDDRTVTIPELKRLVGLPDDYVTFGESLLREWECVARCLPPVLNETVGRTVARAARLEAPA